MAQYVMIIGLVSIFSAIIAAIVAKFKNRSADKWAFASFLFPPALIVLVVLGKNKNPPRKNVLSEKEKRDLKEYMFD